MEAITTNKKVDPLFTLFTMSNKLALISYAIEQAIDDKDSHIDEWALAGISTLIEEMEGNVGDLTDYCQKKEGVKS